MAKEITIVKKTKGVAIYKTPSNWCLKINDKVHQYTEIVNDQNEQAIIFKVGKINYGFLYNKFTGKIGDIFLYDTLMRKEPLFTFK